MEIKKFKLIFFLTLIWIIFGSNKVFANEKYVTIVNPVRSRDLWQDKTLKPIEDQYKIIDNLGLKTTWLIQNDVINDQELIKKIKEFNQDQEIGLFLEISPKLAKEARIYYPTETEWYSPKAVFLSAHSVSDRKKLIDKIIIDFKNTFGYLPKSAGAWWIDSWSEQYLEKKYNIATIMIVADQKTTDKYGVWGQWWGYPYHPSPNNILVPGNSKTVIIQWAQRDLEKAYHGSGPLVSNYSLQANDYTSQGLDIKYFATLANQYLSVEKLGQITVGLETGMESIGHEKEYEKQLNWLVENKVTSLKMSEFGDKYRELYDDKNPSKIILGNWVLTPEYRENINLKEKTIYNPSISFSDKFIADKTNFLNRILSDLNNRQEIKYWPLFLLLIPILCWWSKSISPVLFIILLYLPIFRSYYSSGWKIFFGPIINNLILGQVLVFVIGVFLITKINQKFKINWSSWLSIWIINLLIFTARFSIIDGKYYLGFLVDSFKFIGISYGHGLTFLNQDFPGYVAATMLKFDPNWIWNNWWSWIIIYPIIEIGLVFLFNKILSKKLRYFLTILSIFFVIYIFKLNPLIVR
ncbi:MAG: hypothetical protein PHE32_00420 [Candidatus Shapirobacteria bacterium]|nr:hypothetical protein [Candidatus Shapirobacteria bacterium]MDD4410161.1 hypothetical protein [Candidatus Shapirobacteria bacterium]